MSTSDPNQSAIAEVRDQMSLDYADGSYLNVVSNNYGLRRADVDVSSISFDDDTWRAIVKAIGVQYKQILTQFEAVLEIVLGPKITEVGTFAEDIEAGVDRFEANETLQFPQVGTLVLDEGLATEETVEVCYIDRYNQVIYLTTETLYAHTGTTQDAEQPLVFSMLAGDETVYVPFSENFPTTDFPYTLVLGRGTETEETVQLLGNDLDTNALAISACLNSHDKAIPSQTRTTVFLDYVEGSYFLSLADVTQFTETGIALLATSPEVFTCTATGTVTTAIVAASTFTENRHVRHRAIFEGNITPALAGVSGDIILNTDTTLTFLTDLPDIPDIGDNFSIRPMVEYTSVDYDNDQINIRRDIVDITVGAGTDIELLAAKSEASLAPLKMTGVGWDIFQVDLPDGPPTVEILLPSDILEEGNLRANSYFHTEYIDPAPSTILTDGALIDGIFYTVDDNTGFPIVGVITIDLGGATEENICYSIDQATIADDIPIGVTSIELNSGAEYFEYPFIALIDDGVNPSEQVTVSAVNANNATVSATVNAHKKGATFRAIDYIRVAIEGSTTVFPIGTTVDLYQPLATALPDLILDGNLWTIDDVFPGPYIYDPDVLGIQQINNAGVLNTDTYLDGVILSKPSRVMMTQLAGRTALEIEDASAFPLDPAGIIIPFPFQIEIGLGGPNRERIDVNNIALKQRTVAETAGITAIGSTTLVVTSAGELDTGGGIPASQFLDAEGYRIRIDPGGANDEIAYVTSFSALTFTFQSGLLNGHAAGERVELLADLLQTDPLTDTHDGVFENTAANKRIDVAGTGFPANYFSSIRYADADAVQPIYVSIPTTDSTGLDLTGSNVYMNFGNGRVNVETNTDAGITAAVLPDPAGPFTFTCDDTSVFPTDYPFLVVIDPGKANEEILEVIDNDTGTDTLTTTAPSLQDHASGARVTFTPGSEDTIAYTSITGDDLDFASSTGLFNQTYHSGTTITLSPGADVPQVIGYDFPLKMPSDLEDALRSVLDLVRAAGVLVTFIDQA